MPDDERIASILGEWRERRDRGETADPEDVIRAHPDLADALRAKFEAVARMEDALGSETDAEDARLRTVPSDRYADYRPVGEGGMGIVYWAIDTDLNREVAFKVIRPATEAGPQATPEEPSSLVAPGGDTPASQAFETLKQRFLQEAWVTGGLSHPGIVPVYELGQTPEGIPYYTMRFVKGKRTLADAVEAAGAQDIEERLGLLEPFLKVCDAIGYAHTHGVIHRDLKPENVALGEFGEVVVIDWGLAKLKDQPDEAAERWQDRIQEYREATDMKTVAAAMGTPGYMAPEAAKGQAALMDARSDVYSLGVMLFQILTGRLPIEGETFGEMMLKLIREEAPAAKIVDDAVPQDLSDLCARCLAREPAGRPAGAVEIAEAVRGWQAQSAADREIQGWLRDANGALATARTLAGDARLKALDRAAAACTQVLQRRIDHAPAQEVQARIAALREEGMRERARGERRRVLLRVGLGALVVGVVAAVIVAWLLEQRRREAEDARAREATERTRADQEADTARRERDRAQALVISYASGEAGRTDPMLGLLLAREAVRRQAVPATVNRLHEALGRSLERARVPAVPVGMASMRRRGHLAVFAPGGDRLLLAQGAGDIRVLSLGGRVLARSPEGSDLTAVSAAWSPSGDRIAVGCWDGSVRLLGEDLREQSVFEGHDDAVLSVAVSPDGESVVSASKDGTARLWSADGRERAVLEGDEKPVAIAAFSPDGQRILTAEAATLLLGRPAKDAPAAKTAWLWTSNGERVATLVGHEGSIRAASFSPDGELVLTAAEDGSARIWTPQGEEVARLEPGIGPLHGAVWSTSGDVVLTGSGKKCAVVKPDGEVVRSIELEEDAWANAWRLLPPDDRVLALGGMGRSWIWDRKGDLLHVLRGPRSDVDGMAVIWRALVTWAVEDRGRWAFTGHLDGTQTIWATQAGEDLVLQPSQPEGTGLTSCELVAGGRIVATAHGAWNRPTLVRLWDRDGRLLLERTATHALWATKTGRVLLTDGAGKAVLLEPDGGSVVELELGEERGKLALSPAGDRVLWGKTDRRARLWDDTGRLLMDRPIVSRYLGRIEFSPDGRKIVAPLFGKGVVLRADGRTEMILESERASIQGLEFSQDGSRILAWAEGTPWIEVWETTGRRMAQIYNESNVSAAALCPVGRYVAAALGDRTVRIWDEEGNLRTTIATLGEGAVTVAFSPDGESVLTGGHDGTARLWDLEGNEQATLRAGGRGPVRASFSPSGDRILTTDARGVIRLWITDPEALLARADERITRAFTPGEQRQFAELLGESVPTLAEAEAQAEGGLEHWKTGEFESAVRELEQALPLLETRSVRRARAYLGLAGAYGGRAQQHPRDTDEGRAAREVDLERAADAFLKAFHEAIQQDELGEALFSREQIGDDPTLREVLEIPRVERLLMESRWFR